MTEDKIQHFWIGFLLSLLGTVLLPFVTFGFAWGIGKEVYDRYHPDKHTADIFDAIAAWTGATLALIIVILVRHYVF